MKDYYIEVEEGLYQIKDYYDIMRLPRNATIEEVKISYRNLAKRYHPDASSEKDAEKKFIEMKEAYDVLINQDTKDEYDDDLRSYEEELVATKQMTQNEVLHQEQVIPQEYKPFVNYIQMPRYVTHGMKSLFETTKEHGLKFALSLYGFTFYFRLLSSLILIPLIFIYIIFLQKRPIIDIEIGIILSVVTFVFIWFIASFKNIGSIIGDILMKYSPLIIGGLLLWLYINS